MRDGQQEQIGGYFKQFLIQYSGLVLGQHNFEFNINNTFFDRFSHTDLQEGDVQLNLSLERQTDMLILTFSFNGYVKLPCDRCADMFNFTIDSEEQLIVKFHHEDGQAEHEDVLFLSLKEFEIDISQHIYEFINLQMPIRKVHENEKECNQDMIKRLNELNRKDKEDPRWDQLKKLTNK